MQRQKKIDQIDQKDIFKAIPDTPENVEILDALYTELTEAAIDVVGITEPTVSDLLTVGLMRALKRK